MSIQINSVDVFVRRIAAPRMDFQIGKGQSLFPEWMRGNLVIRLTIDSTDGAHATGCSGDWPSFGWLDKRPGIDGKTKLRELLELVSHARDTLLFPTRYESAFDAWWNFHERFLNTPQAAASIDLCNAFAMALFERALIDATCRLENLSFHQALRDGQLGFKPEVIHAEVRDWNPRVALSEKPLSRIAIRHTVGLGDPLEEKDIATDQRIKDGQPQALQQYVTEQGIRHFKIKVCGDIDSDVHRLSRIWKLVSETDPVITLDGNESFQSVGQLRELVDAMQQQLPALFEHTELIEQPLNRDASLDTAEEQSIREISARCPLIIDEADGTLDSFSRATAIGYRGVSHKNCKGVFKSLANLALCQHRNQFDKEAKLFLSAEDLTSMPVVPLHQDFAVVATLGLKHAERNAHHYFGGLDHLTDREQFNAVANYGNLYHQTDERVSMNVVDGEVDISKLDCVGIGVRQLPDWSSMQPLSDWISALVQQSAADSRTGSI